MKKFECVKCHKYLGEMDKGKIHKEAFILCDKCMKFYKTCDSLASYNKGTGKGLGDIFKDGTLGDILGGKLGSK